MAQQEHPQHGLRYEPDERPPHGLSLGLGFQAALLVFAGVILTPAIVLRAAGQPEPYLSWAIFMAVVISGLSTMLQTTRIGRVGAGHVLIMGTSATSIAVCVAALTAGGPALLATLTVVSALFQLGLTTRLSLLGRIITPVVSGTAIALLVVTIAPIVVRLLTSVPEGTSSAAAPACAGATLATIVALTLRASGALRLWTPLIGIGAGCLVASLFGLYDFGRVGGAAWVGLPAHAWPGFDLEFDSRFWLLLPAFVLVTLVGSLATIGDAVAIQRVSWRTPRAVDYRTVQGAMTAEGLGILLSGLAGTIPPTSYSTSMSIVELTGAGARRIGVYIGLVFVGLAFLPKVTAALLAIPGPVVAAYMMVALSLLFVQGMKVIVQGGVDYRTSLVAGLAFWIGLGFQNEAIFADQLGETLGGLLGNGMTAGCLAALVMTLFMELTAPRRRRLETELETTALPRLDAFLRELAARRGWNSESTERLRSAGEEALLSLVHQEDDATNREGRRLLVVARGDSEAAELEFIAAVGEKNLEDRMVLLGERTDTPNERELSVRLLRRFASSVRHQQYHDIDIVTVRVDGSR